MDTLLEIKHITKTFARNGSSFPAVSDVCFRIRSGESVGLVGESGSGKSTIAKIITRTVKADGGQVYFGGKDVARLRRKELKLFCREVQVVYQNPQDSFDPRRRLGYSLTEGLCNYGVPRAEAVKRAGELLEICGLSPEYLQKYPHEVSGGECQRAAIARAVLLKPKLLICDEATSALDVTVQSQIMGLLEELHRETGMAYLIISHDLVLVQNICSRMLVMHQGRIVEEGTPDEVIMSPRQEYTRRLAERLRRDLEYLKRPQPAQD